MQVRERERETVEARSSLSEPEVEGAFSREMSARQASLGPKGEAR
jgi:hypothetical protein